MMIHLPTLIARCVLLCVLLPQDLCARDLVVYIRDSFYTKWEEPLRRAYAPHGTLRFIRLSGTALMTRLRMEGAHTKADVVVGAESLTMPQLREMGCVGRFKDMGAAYDVPFKVDADWVPFSYGYLGVLYNGDLTKGMSLPKKWEDLAHLPRRSLLCANPQTSSTGLMFWELIRQRGLEKTIQARFLSLPKGLSQTYALFAAGKAAFVVGFTTSSAHRTGNFAMGPIYPLLMNRHPVLAYVAFVTPRAQKHKETGAFLECLISPPIQSLVWEADHLYPVIKDLRQKIPVPEPEPITMAFTQKDQQGILAHFMKSYS